MTALLDVRGLSVLLPGAGGATSVVHDVDLSVAAGEVVGLAGESGSGKTMTAMAVMGLTPPGAEVRGRIELDGTDLLSLKPSRMRDVRGRVLAMVFQDPTASLHPMLTIECQLTEHVRHHLELSGAAARQRALGLLHEVRIPDPGAALGAYPHHFSGGMRQRLAIAMAIACEPRVLIADEATTALDVTVQAGILQLLDQLRRQQRLAVLLISHDLGVLAALADRVSVMYAGRVVESGPTDLVLSSPRHPYTRGLLDSLPRVQLGPRQPLVPISGAPPSPWDRPSGCAFHPRCRHATARCHVELPVLAPLAGGRRVACPVDPLRAERATRA